MKYFVSEVKLRDVVADDLPIFFKQQQDSLAIYMAAFTAKDPSDWAAFMNHWTKIIADEKISIKTIIFNGNVAGHIAKFIAFGETEVTYWIGKEYWGKGIATKALSMFLDLIKVRPIYARAAKDNIASIRVLEKCGFIVTSEDKGYSNARFEEVEEFILVLRL